MQPWRDEIAPSPQGRLGLIAGNGRLPLLVADAASRKGWRVVAVAHRGETLPEIESIAHEVTWVPVGAIGRIANVLSAAGVRRAILAGGLGKASLLRDFRPDLAAIGILARVRSRDDDVLLRAVAAYFEGRGLEIVDAAPLIPDLYAPEGLLSRRKPTGRQREDIERGWEIAKALGGLDVGQAVAVKSGATIAVEAVEGTDALVRRAGRLAGAGTVIVKVAKPTQDLRFDIPTVGPGTIGVMKEAGAAVLAVEAERTLILDREEMIAAADSAKIVVVGWKR